MIARLLLASWFAWCFARPTPLSCDMQFSPTRQCDVNATAHLTEEDLDRLAAEATEETFAEFAARVFPRFKRYKYVLELFDAMDGLRYGEALRLLLRMPPRHGKTTAILIVIAYLLTHHMPVGDVQVAYVTYGDSLSHAKSREVQRYVRAAGCHIVKGESAVNEWSVVETGARFCAGGIDTAWTGKGYTHIFGDDLMKNSEEARSGLRRDNRWTAWSVDLATRLDEPERASVVLMGTPWHLDDPIGRTIGGQYGEEFQQFARPAINDNGEPLCPERFPLAILAKIRARDEHAWWALYMLDPRPLGTQMFHAAPVPFNLSAFLEDEFNPLSSYRWILAVDPATSSEQSADFSAAILLAMRGNGDDAQAWIVDLWHAQKETPDVCDAVVEMRKEWAARGVPGIKVVVEAIGGFKGTWQTIRKMLAPKRIEVLPCYPATDKKTRATAVAAAWNAHRVYLPRDRAWRDKVLREVGLFTGQDDPNDDIIDALSHAWNKLWTAAPALVRGPRAIRLHGLG